MYAFVNLNVRNRYPIAHVTQQTKTIYTDTEQDTRGGYTVLEYPLGPMDYNTAGLIT